MPNFTSDTGQLLSRDVQRYLLQGTVSVSNVHRQCRPDPNAKWLWNTTEILQDLEIPQYDWMRVYSWSDLSFSPPPVKVPVVVPNQSEYIFDIPEGIMKVHWSKAVALSPHLAHYKKASSDVMLDELFLTQASQKDKYVLLLSHVFVDNWGLVVHPESCMAFRNGACHPATKPFAAKPTSSYPLVITIATSWTGTWHFPMEDLVGLAYIDEGIASKAVIHVPYTSLYLEKWLLAIGVERGRIVTGTIGVQVLLVPQLAMCGKPFPSQLTWLREKVQLLLSHAALSLDRNHSTMNHPLPLPQPSDHTSSPKALVVFIERSDVRDLKSPQKSMLKSVVLSFARQHHMRVAIHDGRSDAQSIVQQVEPFSGASIVVGEHGAGLLFAAFAPRDVCIIEISSARNPLCYARLAYLHKQHYIMLHFQDIETDKNTLRAALSKCHGVLKTQQRIEDESRKRE